MFRAILDQVLPVADARRIVVRISPEEISLDGSLLSGENSHQGDAIKRVVRVRLCA